MKFIIDGDGYISDRMALDLLTDIARPLKDCAFVLIMKPKNDKNNAVNRVIYMFDDVGFRQCYYTTDIRAELDTPGDKAFIVVGEQTRPELVEYCHSISIPVMDITRALYPVTARTEKTLI